MLVYHVGMFILQSKQYLSIIDTNFGSNLNNHDRRHMLCLKFHLRAAPPSFSRFIGRVIRVVLSWNR